MGTECELLTSLMCIFLLPLAICFIAIMDVVKAVKEVFSNAFGWLMIANDYVITNLEDFSTPVPWVIIVVSILIAINGRVFSKFLANSIMLISTTCLLAECIVKNHELGRIAKELIDSNLYLILIYTAIIVASGVISDQIREHIKFPTKCIKALAGELIDRFILYILISILKFIDHIKRNGCVTQFLFTIIAIFVVTTTTYSVFHAIISGQNVIIIAILVFILNRICVILYRHFVKNATASALLYKRNKVKN